MPTAAVVAPPPPYPPPPVVAPPTADVYLLQVDPTTAVVAPTAADVAPTTAVIPPGLVRDRVAALQAAALGLVAMGGVAAPTAAVGGSAASYTNPDGRFVEMATQTRPLKKVRKCVRKTTYGGTSHANTQTDPSVFPFVG
jgi:hypothetical protein